MSDTILREPSHIDTAHRQALAPSNPPPRLPPALPRRQEPSARGVSKVAVFTTTAAVASLLWGVWVTRELLAPAPSVPMASVRLEALISEYVMAQARSNAPPEIVTQQTQGFMSALGEEIRARGQMGTTVLVGEAVLSNNVPDITGEIRQAIYARVPPPAAAPQPQAAPIPGLPVQPMLPGR